MMNLNDIKDNGKISKSDAKCLDIIYNNDDGVMLFESCAGKGNNQKSYLFSDPREYIEIKSLSHISGALKRIERLSRKGYYAAGYISYEAGFAFEGKLKKYPASYMFPLLKFGIYEKPAAVFAGPIHSLCRHIRPQPPLGLKARFDINERDYCRKISAIKKEIQKGRTYQVNFTFKAHFTYKNHPFDLYCLLRQTQPVSYAAYLNFGSKSLISFSPELFFRLTNRDINVAPMKGTWPRGISAETDKINKNLLRQSAKDRSENIMIVDLMRNDLGRICQEHSIKTSKLFHVETYKTLYQMTSSVSGKVRKGTALGDIFQNMFPSGSVTGAPKVNTMRIIRKLEKSKRGPYTGSIGVVFPKNKAVFNIAIRTIELDRKTGKAAMGVGSGIVYDSEPKKEYRECLLKTHFLEKSCKNYEIFETILWQKKTKKPFLLSSHMRRMRQSARRFDFPFKKQSVVNQVSRYIHTLNKAKNHKIKISLRHDGTLGISSVPVTEHKSTSIPRIIIAGARTNSKNTFLYHKTSERALYDGVYKIAKSRGYYDAVFFNEKNELTEGCINNIFLKSKNFWYTPKIGCGLLNGVYRQHLLGSPGFEGKVREKILKVNDLYDADEIYLTNSVRGKIKVSLDRVNRI